MNSLDFCKKKIHREKISMVTCYDYTSACILAKTNIDCILVGDSAAMTMHGYSDTVSATIDMMYYHTAAVRRGAKNKFIIGDLPFLSYRQSINKSMEAVKALMQAGAHAIKLEGATGNLKLIRHLSDSGIPVIGHIGLTPQFIHGLGGYKIQGETDASVAKLKDDAMELQNAGCVAIVLECMPTQLAKDITTSLMIPTIGIGAGAFTDGQVLVFQDLLGLNPDFNAKFVKKFMNGAEQIKNSVNTFIHEINTGLFPNDEHSYRN
ncbi:MAG: 3-methyl-2-oxobutanoate hydroxymethyltransferase [Gammaproteobacteria bacterium]